MCLFKTPKISTPQVQTTAAQLVPSTSAEEPDSPQFCGTEDTFNKRKGRNALKINLDKGGYNPVNY